jgi:hypothetical protein
VQIKTYALLKDPDREELTALLRRTGTADHDITFPLSPGDRSVFLATCRLALHLLRQEEPE